ncbi:MAG: hypothetical protein AAF149_15895 [Bacteroidota bacterium]
MISKILKFELKARFTQPLTIIYFLMLVFQGIWYTQGSYKYYVNDATLMNGSAIFYKTLAGGGMLLCIILALITGTVLYKDIQHKTSGIIYATPVNQKSFFLGRFISAYLINLILASGIMVGLALAPYSGIGTPDKFGPTPWAQMFHGFFTLTAVNILMLTMVCFSAIVFFRKMAAGYLSIFLVVLFFIVGESTKETASNRLAYELIDPFTYVYTGHQMDDLPATNKNTAFLGFTTTFFFNRLIWIGGAFLLFFLAYRKFSFKHFIASPAKRAKTIIDIVKPLQFKNIKVPKAVLDFSSLEFMRKFWRLSVLEFKNVVRPVNFKIILGILALMFFLQNVMWNATYYLGPTQPLTSTMTYVRLPMGFFITLLIMIWAGELFFKDRISNIWQITDALPVPVWVTTVSKYLAMAGVAFITASLIIVCGLLAQVLMGGFQEIDLFRYADDVLGYKWGWLNFLQYIALVFFLAGVTGHRFLTHILGAGYYLFNIICFDTGIMEEVRYGYALVPGVEDFSDISGYGIWSISSWWFFLLWTALALVFVFLGIHFWKRGTSLNFMRKLTFQTNQLSLSGKSVIVLGLVAFFSLQSFIQKEVYDKGNFQSEAQEALEDANYEKKYKWIESKKHPKLVGLDLNLDLFPANRKASYQATMQLINPHLSAIDTLYLYHEDFVSLEEIKWNGDLVEVAWNDDDFNQLAVPLKIDSAEIGVLSVIASKQYIGFTQSGEAPQPDLTFNGLFMNAKDILPNIGYHTEREVDRNRDREENGLEKIASRMNAISDSAKLNEDSFTSFADWIEGSITLSTSGDQVATGPGKVIKTWKNEGRNYYQLNFEHESPYDWYFASGEYQSPGFEAGNVQFSFLHKALHDYNLVLYENAIRQSLSFVNDNLGSYPFSELRIIEIPFFQEELYAYPNVIAISEKEGWYADTTGLAERSYMTYTMASQTISHWLYQNVEIGNVQGSDMLKIALPGAMALEVVKTLYGKEAVDGLLDKKKNFYSKERGNEHNQEPPLIYADGADYLEGNKGVVALYKLSTEIGINAFTSVVLEWAEVNKGQKVTFESLYKTLINKLSIESRQKWAEVFETTEGELT